MDGLTRLPTGLNNYGTIASELFKTESIHGMVVTNDREVKTFPLVYTPAAIGISLARILNLGRMPLFLLGRLCNLLLFATLAYFAIKHIPFGKMILVGISLLPMTISLVSSYNYDSYIFGISMLFVANCLRLVYKKNIATNKDYLSILIPAILLAPVKLIYVFLLGLCLLIPKDCFGGTPKNYYKKIFFLFGCGALMLLLSNKASIVSMFGTREVNSWVGAETYSLSYIFSDFFAFAKVIVQTIWTNTPQYLQLMFGGVYNCMMSFEIQITLVVLLGLSSIKIKGEGHEFTTRQKIWLSVLGSTIVGFAILAMFSGYTPTGSTVVLGVQGRYFLPALPLFLFIVRGDWLTLKKSIDNKLLFAFCSVNCVAALRIFQACIER